MQFQEYSRIIQLQKVYILTLLRNTIVPAPGVSIGVKETCFIDPFINLYSKIKLEEKSRDGEETSFIVSLKFEFSIRNTSATACSFS